MFDFAEGRGGQHVRGFLNMEANAGINGWHGKLVCDDFSGYNACFELGVTEVRCLAHARRKFHVGQPRQPCGRAGLPQGRAD